MTWLCFGLGLNFATTAFAYLIVVVLLSLLDSFISSALFSVIAIACLNYFFIEPRFTFQVNYTEDLTALAAFVITSLIVTGLVRRLRDLGNTQREQARLLDLTTDAVFVRDRDDVITYWNRGAQELYGWRPDEAIGRSSHQLLQTVFPAPLADINGTLARTGRWEGEVVHTARDGRKVTVASRWSKQHDAQGDAIGTLESNTDITERRRAEDALHRSQAAYLAEAQKLSLTGSFGWNVSSGELLWSDETFRIFSHDPATRPTVEAALARVHPEDVSLVRGVIERAARNRQDFDFEHRLQLPDGSIKHLHVVAHAVMDEPDKPQFIGAVMDVTARKRTEEALRYSEHRYTNLFQAMAASFWELDFSGVDGMLRGLLKSGAPTSAPT